MALKPDLKCIYIYSYYIWLLLGILYLYNIIYYNILLCKCVILFLNIYINIFVIYICICYIMWQTHAKPMVKINHPQSYHSWVGFLNGPKESKTKAARIETPSRVSQKQ